MQAEFSQLIKEENFIRNTSLVHIFNSGGAGLLRAQGDKSPERMAWNATAIVSQSERTMLAPSLGYWLNLCSSMAAAPGWQTLSHVFSQQLSKTCLLGTCQWKMESLFLNKSHTFLFVPQRDDIYADPPKPTKILANIQVLSNTIKNFSMPKGFVCVH